MWRLKTLTLLSVNVKKSYDSIRCKHYLKEITKTRGKMLQLMKTPLWEKWTQNFKTLAWTLHAKQHSGTSKSNWIRIWLYGAGCLGKSVPVCWDSLEKWWIPFARKFLIAWNRADLHSSSSASLVSVPDHIHEIPSQVGQSVGGRILI